ncbi:PREDICTED: uncharacterized protein LOC108555176 [Eufriesea mexicana]|uniref:uncharacterized protein LOC108555176 n=1 Tax=Eufriesea mexicana TaxID=516756 RepID=UPI00083C4C12|nr:PREDICTED: uncharacterized protein LOC108555176 [Eufriesea mexicana]
MDTHHRNLGVKRSRGLHPACRNPIYPDKCLRMSEKNSRGPDWTGLWTGRKGEGALKLQRGPGYARNFTGTTAVPHQRWNLGRAPDFDYSFVPPGAPPRRK